VLSSVFNFSKKLTSVSTRMFADFPTRDGDRLHVRHPGLERLADIEAGIAVAQRLEILAVAHIVVQRKGQARIEQDAFRIDDADTPRQIERFIDLLEPRMHLRRCDLIPGQAFYGQLGLGDRAVGGLDGAQEIFAGDLDVLLGERARTAELTAPAEMCPCSKPK
jgi:hypothetical protein